MRLTLTHTTHGTRTRHQVLVVMGFSTVNWDLVTSSIPLAEVNWSLYMTTLFWSNNYWDAVSTLVRDDRTPFI
jgi:hypothetical protein